MDPKLHVQLTLTIRPILRALLEFPSCFAWFVACWYFSSLCCKASETSLGGEGGSKFLGALLSPPDSAAVEVLGCGSAGGLNGCSEAAGVSP